MPEAIPDSLAFSGAGPMRGWMDVAVRFKCWVVTCYRFCSVTAKDLRLYKLQSRVGFDKFGDGAT